ncbi:MAG: hypothetical protein JNM80_03765 [Phycisphaerae bacterium]|nr:hypothetical protein [Phycisphaerae bacterium]
MTGVGSGYVSPTLSNIQPGPTPPQGFDSTWSPGVVQPAWVGTFSATGPTTGSGDSGTTRYGFSTLATGVLPAGTVFAFGDLDNRGSNEVFVLEARDAFGAVITTPWLDVPGWVSGAGTGPLGAPAVSDMPGWDWNGTRYRFGGMQVASQNPALTVELVSNRSISYVEVQKFDTLNGFALRAPPMPAPGAGVAALAGIGVLARRRRRD